jgi:hypothetical protein
VGLRASVSSSLASRIFATQVFDQLQHQNSSNNNNKDNDNNNQLTHQRPLLSSSSG